MKRRKLSDEQIEEMGELYLGKKMSLSEIGDRIGISAPTVRYWLKKNGVKARKMTASQKYLKKYLEPKNRTYKILDKKELSRLYLDQKLPIREIKNKLKTSFAVIRRSLDYHKIPEPEKERLPRVSPELLKDLFLTEKMTAEQIAGRLGLPAQIVRHYLDKFGITGKSPKEFSAPNEKETVWFTPTDIAREYNLTNSTVRRLLRNKIFPNATEKKAGQKTFWLVPSGDLENFSPRAKGGQRAEHPSVETILKRGTKAENKVRELYGYGKPELIEMIRLEKEGIEREKIAGRFRVDLSLVNDILEKAVCKAPKLKKTPKKRILKRLPKDQLIELYSNTKFSIKDIIEKLGTNYASLYINLRYYGIPLRDNDSRRSAFEKEQNISRLYLNEKKTPLEIAELLDLTESYIKRKLRELKIWSK